MVQRVLLAAAFSIGLVSVPAVLASRGDRDAAYSTGDWRNASVDEEQRRFVALASRIADRFGVEIWYDVCSHGYVWEHLLPIFHALPGRILAAASATERSWPPGLSSGRQQDGLLTRGFREGDVVEGTPEVVQAFLRTSRRHLVLAAGGIRDWMAEKWGLRRGVTPFEQLWTLSHGIDEGHFWGDDASKLSHGAGLPPVLFSRYLRKQRSGAVEALMSRLTPGMPTVVYLASILNQCHSPAFLTLGPVGVAAQCGSSGRGHGHRAVVAALRHLVRTGHNVVVRLHPQDIEERGLEAYRALLPGCLFDDYRAGRSAGDLAGVADIVVAEPSGSTFAVLHDAPKTPIVYLLRDREMYGCVKDKVLNESMADVVFLGPPAQVAGNRSSAPAAALLRAVRRTMGTTVGDQQVQARLSHVRRYYGDIDGFEEYRFAAALLRRLVFGDRTMARALVELEGLLARFSVLPVDQELPQPPICDTPCCREDKAFKSS
mmetsp:Transcript_8891/g.26981  ORF Transcript_8891/g.26981 Transcript_8891/m.26981 type:complete len:488 (+) Transcript_8891:69-1532(+)